MLDEPNNQPPGNPYRRSRPRFSETVAHGKFYLANDKGSYGTKTSPVYLALCPTYLWVSETLSIPLESVTECGLTKHGGYICYWDGLAGEEVRFNFTKLGFLRFRRRDVEAFLDVLENYLPARVEQPGTTAEVVAPPDPIGCEKCGSGDAYVLVFEVFRFVGLVPIAWAYKLTPSRYVLCAEHARSEARRCARSTALQGYWGFPGFLAAPWYIYRNLRTLRRAGMADPGTTVSILLTCIVLPCALIALPIILLFWS